jgi:hypothetical protein
VPPSDHDVNRQVFLAFAGGDGAEMVLVDPWMTVLLKRAAVESS